MAHANLIDVIDNLYASACDGSWTESLRGVTGLVGGGGATLGVTDASGVPTFFKSYGVSSESVGEFIDHYAFVSPRVEYSFSLPMGSTFAEQDFILDSEMARSEFYVDFLFKHGWGTCIGGVVINDDTGFAGFTVERSRNAPPVSGDSLRMIKTLLPHFKRALSISRHFEQADQRAETYSQAFSRLTVGMAFLDKEGRICEMNEQASKLLQQKNGLYAPKGRLKAVNYAQNDMLQKLLVSTVTGLARGQLIGSAGGEMEISGKDGIRLNLMISPATSFQRLSEGFASVIYVSKQEPLDAMSPEALARIYGLTRMETRLAATIVCGQSLKDYAQLTGITAGTARWHLHNVLSKTDTRGQSDLILKLLRSPTPWLKPTE